MKEFTRDEVVQFVTEKIAARAKMDVSDLPAERILEEVRLNSLDVVLISGEVEDEFEVEIDPIMMFESKTINEVADRVLQLKVQ